MPNPNPNPNPAPQDGKDGVQNDPWEKLRGTKDANGVPQHPDEKAEFYKKKSDNSNVEAQRIIGENKSLLEENQKLKVVPPQGNAMNTNIDITSKIPNWGTLSPEQQTTILSSFGTLHNDVESMKGQVAKMLDRQNFDASYNALVLNDEFAILDTFKSEFIVEAYKGENLKTPLRTLAVAFLAEKGKWGTASDPNPTPSDAGRSGLDDGDAGNSAPPAQQDTYTSQEASELRVADPKKWARLVSSKKLTIKD